MMLKYRPFFISETFRSMSSDPTLLTVGKKTAGSIASANEVDTFSIDLEAGKTYVIRINGLGASAGNTLTFKWDSGKESATTGGSGGLPVISVTPPNAGRYTFEFAAGSLTGDYTVQVDQVTTRDDFGSTPYNAGSLDAGLIYGQIEQPNDKDAFRLELPIGVGYTAKVAAGAPADMILTAFSRGGQVMASDSAFSGLSLVKTYDEEFFTLVASSPSGATGKYELSWTKANDDYPPSTQTTGTITLGTPVSGRIEIPGDLDWFALDLDARYRYKFTLSGDAGQVFRTQIYKDSSYFYAGMGVTEEYQPIVSGKHYFQITGASAGNYTVQMTRMEDDHGNSADSASKLGAAGVTGNLNYLSDADWFAFEATAGEVVSLVLDVKGLDQVAEAFRPTLVMAEISRGAGTFAVSGTEYKVTATGTYYAVISSHTILPNVSYSLGLKKVAPPVPAADDIPSKAAAPTLEQGLATSARLESSADIDYFKARLEAGVSYTLHLSGEATAGFINLSLHNAADQQVGLSGSYPSYYSFTATKTGDHIFTVPATYTTGSYSLTLNPLAGDAVGGSIATAQALALDEIMTTNLGGNGQDIDMFAVELVAGTSYVADFRVLTQTYSAPNFSLLDKAGVEMKNAVPYLDAEGYRSVKFSITPTVSGAHYFKVSDPFDSTALYRLTVGETPADDVPNTADRAMTLDLDNTFEGRLESTVDVDYFKSSLEAGKFYEIDYRSLRTTGEYVRDNYEVALTTPDGQALFGVERFLAEKSGDYLFRVTGSPDDLVNRYRLLVKPAETQDDHGFSKLSATQITTGKTIAGVNEFGTDRDYFSVYLQRGFKYDLSIKAAGATSGKVVIDVPNGVDQNYFNHNLATPWIISIPADQFGTGDYIIDLGLKGSNTFSYSLSIAAVSSDTIAPTLVSQIPAVGATTVPVSSDITLTFSEAMKYTGGTIALSDKSSNVVARFDGGANHITVDGATVKFDLRGILEPGQEYSMLALGLTDLVGNAAPMVYFSFKTDPADAAPTPAGDLLLDTRAATIDGGAGIDTLYLTGARSSYTFKKEGGSMLMQRADGASTTLSNLERVYFKNSNDALALDVDGVAGQAYRIYQAAFGRTPDSEGLGFWIHAMDGGTTLKQVAAGFAASAEFKSLYGSAPAAAQLVAKLYENVLHRPGEQAGIDFWTKALSSGVSTVDVLAAFSESAENQAGVAAVIGNGFSYTIF
jgi:hypothetical protein